MIAAIRHGLANLASFKGRDARGQFWPYAGVVILLTFLGCWAVMVPAVASTFAKMQRFAVEHPDASAVTRTPTSYSVTIQGSHPELMPDFRGLMAAMIGVFAVAVLLLAAAVVRRLHDRGRSGLWGLLPVPFLAFGAAGSVVIFSSFNAPGAPDMRLFGAMMFNNLAYLATLLILIVMLAGEGAKGANRFGEPAAS